MKKEEFVELLLTETGINVVAKILEFGMMGVTNFEVPKIVNLAEANEWKIAKEIVEQCVTADTLFYWLSECERRARKKIAVNGYVDGTKLPTLNSNKDEK